MEFTHTVVFFLREDKKQVYLLRKDMSKKNKPHMMHLHNKLNGIGGKIDETDENEYFGAKREVHEEINVNLDDFEVEKVGYFIRENNINIAIFKVSCDSSNYQNLPLGEIQGEGEINWYPYNYPIENIKELPYPYYVEIYKKLLIDNSSNIILDFRNLED